MSLTHKFLNIALPLVTLIVLPIITVPFLFFKLVLSVKKLVCIENLTRKVVLITGSASGIGEQLAYEYAKRGAVLSLVDVREDNLKAVADKARSLGSPDVITIVADVSKVENCKRFVDETVNYFGHSKLFSLQLCLQWIPSAGTVMVEKLEDCIDISVPRPIMDVNFWGALYGTLFAIPHLKRSRGKIVVIASGLGWYPLPRLGYYNASKAAIINFFETLRTELGWAIGFTIVSPGFIKTDLSKRILASEASLRLFPMASAEECAKAVVQGVCRGDLYVTYPLWVRLGFPLKVIFPELVDWLHRLVFRISTNAFENKENLNLSQNSQLKAE
ncbi:11-beta-hydroxysteroid dehydrogenase-like 4A [Neltuma alba]|uniref:11-beta-hydroxysteroid dehydrogenase-like 4A n=1 Tax=Neltuma alba TaxID=207710 RepID=UPI0010A5664D|nr:11-beta-hydroxysteroid dehydrogenase-like 4A [Prosopis alba]